MRWGDVLPPELFRRLDESSDAEFYGLPRIVTHIDDATIAALTAFYRERIPAGAHVLDLMSSWVSHLPPDVEYARVAGLGMNGEELARNPRLDRARRAGSQRRRRRCPGTTTPSTPSSTPCRSSTSSGRSRCSPRCAACCAPGGLHIVATSHRMFPTKAIAAWHALEPADRLRLICRYVELAGGSDEPRVLDRSPPDADPLWIVLSCRSL